MNADKLFIIEREFLTINIYFKIVSLLLFHLSLSEPKTVQIVLDVMVDVDVRCVKPG